MISARILRLIERVNPALVDDLLDAGFDKDRVRVVKHTWSKREFSRGKWRVAMDDLGEVRGTLAGLLRKDELRILAGLKPLWLPELVAATDGELVSVTANLRTDVGIDYVADSLGKSTSRPAVAEYMALSENATAPATTDTTLASEITTSGLARAIATYAHTSTATSYTLSKTFTASGSFSAVQKEAIFNAASSGTMLVENTFPATPLVSSDQLTVTHTLNI